MQQTPKNAHNANCQDWPCLCSYLFLFPQTAYCPTECIHHPIVHHIAVAKCSGEGCSIPNWKKKVSEVSSQLCRKLRDDILKQIFVHIPHLILSNLRIGPSILISEPTCCCCCCWSYLLFSLRVIVPMIIMTISNAHPYEDVKE